MVLLGALLLAAGTVVLMGDRLAAATRPFANKCPCETRKSDAGGRDLFETEKGVLRKMPYNFEEKTHP